MEKELNNLCKDCYFYFNGACRGEETEFATDFFECPDFERVEGD